MHPEQFYQTEDLWKALAEYNRKIPQQTTTQNVYKAAKKTVSSKRLVATTPYNEQDWEEAKAIWDSKRALFRKKEEERLASSTCVWCGEVIEGDLDAHENECTS